MKNKRAILENTLRSYIRKELRTLVEADKGVEETEPEQEVDDTEPEEQEPVGLDPEFDSILRQTIRKLHDSKSPVELEDVIYMVGDFINAFAPSNDSKLTILRNVRDNIVH